VSHPLSAGYSFDWSAPIRRCCFEAYFLSCAMSVALEAGSAVSICQTTRFLRTSTSIFDPVTTPTPWWLGGNAHVGQ
jgi:hypothetical protein